jgi:ATP-binding cassette subfamily B protein
MITHRLSTLVGSDAIIVLDRGRVVDNGRHNELADRPGLYQDLWRQQSRAFR